MKTDDLLDALAADLAPAPARAVHARLLAGAGAAVVIALALVLFWLKLRPDLAVAVGGPTFWMKAAYTVALSLAGFLCAERLSRPATSARGGVTVAALAVAILAALGAAGLALAPSSERLTLMMGDSWRRCPVSILALAVPGLAIGLLIMRRFAPTRLRLAGAATGLLAGGVAASAYGLHCPETAPAFVALWYTLGITASAGLGALIGPWALRWR